MVSHMEGPRYLSYIGAGLDGGLKGLSGQAGQTQRSPITGIQTYTLG